MESIVKDFLIKKETMITKNPQPITEVYKLEKKAIVISKVMLESSFSVEKCIGISEYKN